MDPSLQYHTGDPETDPWLWRVRVLEDRALAGGKVFSGKAGWISREWYPLFLAVRRRGKASKNCMPMALFPGWTGRFTGR